MRFVTVMLACCTGVLCISIPALGTSIPASYISPGGREVGIVFDNGSGLSGQAILDLGADNKTIQILLTNTSYAIPSGKFDNPSDQLLTTLYFDLGAPGQGANDPLIVGGTAFVAPGSQGEGKCKLKSGDDVSDHWGFGNYQYGSPTAFLAPNFTSCMMAHTTPFVAGSDLKGPDYGGISAANLADGFSKGLPSIADTIAITLKLDREMVSLDSIFAPGNKKPYVEFGSDFMFIEGGGDGGGGGGNGNPVPEPLTILSVLLALGATSTYIRKRSGVGRHPQK